MEEKFIIHWKSTVTGKTGHGTVGLSKEDADTECRHQSRLHPELLHWFEPAHYCPKCNRILQLLLDAPDASWLTCECGERVYRVGDEVETSSGEWTII